MYSRYTGQSLRNYEYQKVVERSRVGVGWKGLVFKVGSMSDTMR